MCVCLGVYVVGLLCGAAASSHARARADADCVACLLTYSIRHGSLYCVVLCCAAATAPALAENRAALRVRFAAAGTRHTRSHMRPRPSPEMGA